ncbi:MAG: pyridoxamine 5'-phosphate oxidase family protein [Acidimicrobiaceae bacterium]|nr:pyridoxamine 5'-phosphate oxidase family protein [Acidimicrobiia bacterium]MCY4492814.1 pyridoxamine 5'-phosphate oxidase family protein [Acidimicrobiaceae bacterium]
MATNRRDVIRMSESEVDTFIEEQKSLQVGTIERDGSIHLSTLWFAYLDKRVVFETYTKSQKIKNLRRDPRITLLWEDGDVYEQLRGVMVKGTAQLVTDHCEVFPLALEVMKRNQPDIPEELLEQAATHMAAKRTAVVVEPLKVVSWDHRKLSGTY